MEKRFFLLSWILFFHISLFSATHTVCASGCGYSSISAAIAAASPNDIIEIQDATHTEAAIVINKHLTIQGQGQTTTFVQAAASQAAATDAVFIVQDNLTVTFQDLCIRNGNALSTGSSSLVNGGGVYIITNVSTNISFERVSLTNNRADHHGGAVYIHSSFGTVNFVDCVLSNNEANSGSSFADGGAIKNTGATSMNMTRCSVYGNLAGDDGGAIFIEAFNSTNRFVNCSIYNNTSGTGTTGTEGAGFYLTETLSTFEFYNCTITGNTLSTAFSRRGGGIYLLTDGLMLTNTIVANNTGKSNATFGNDIFEDHLAAVTNMSISSSLIMDCSGCSATPSYTTNPNLASADFCGNQLFFLPQAPSDAIGTGTAPSGLIPTDDICGNTRSGNDLGSFSSGSFPVELIHFDGKAIHPGVQLSWATASELNNAGFFVQRRGGENLWKNLAFVSGQGQSNQLHTYSYLDQSPQIGPNYYRLSQLDLNGDIEHSPVIQVDLQESRKWNLFPNPSHGSLTLSGEVHGNLSIQVIDTQGKMMSRFTDQLKLDIQHLPEGFYILLLQDGTNRWQSPFQLIK